MRKEWARVRAYTKDFEQGTKSTKYVFGQEKIKSQTKLWNQLKCSNGQIRVGGLDNVVDEQRKFYSNLMLIEG